MIEKMIITDNRKFMQRLMRIKEIDGVSVYEVMRYINETVVIRRHGASMRLPLWVTIA